MLHNQLCCSI